MTRPQLSWLLFVQLLLLFSTIMNSVLVSGQCLNDQRSHLLHLKNRLKFNLAKSTKLVQWNPEEDCCSWKGVNCDAFGRVTTLELDQESITGGADNLTSLFKLQYLEKLNLGFNYFPYIPIPKAIANLTNLVYLDFSNSGFAGQFPVELSSLTKLVFLDLSLSGFGEPLGTPTMKMVLQNLSNIEELYLDGANLSAHKSEWSQVIATSLPKLRVLSLRDCGISGPIHISLSRIPSLSDIYLDNNNMSTEVPQLIANIPNLRTLSLRYCNLLGQFPVKIFKVPTLQDLDISHNEFLKVNLPFFSKNSSLRTMVLSYTNCSGSLPNSIGNLPMLSWLELSSCNFSGTIPSCLMTSMASTFKVLSLAGNNLTGEIPNTFPTNCSLITLDLSMNHLQGNLPRSLSSCTLLEVLNLGQNKIEDVFPCMFEHPSRLRVLNLRSNKFHGKIECFGYYYSWPYLQIIDIASNNFTGVLSSQFFPSFNNLLTLDFPQEPERGDTFAFHGYGYDSQNGLYYFNIYSNHQNRNHFKFEINVKGLEIQLEKLKTIFTSIDFSNNKFSGKIPESIGDLNALQVLNLSHNEFTGVIPSSIGKLNHLQLLDLSRNQLTGNIPLALNNLGFLVILNLSFNILTGKVPTGRQLDTLLNDSYIGNVGLCGFPLSVSCGNSNDTGSSSTPLLRNKKEIEWMYVTASVGYTVGLGMFSMVLMFCERWRNKLFLQLDLLGVKLFGKKRARRVGPEWREPIRRL